MVANFTAVWVMQIFLKVYLYHILQMDMTDYIIIKYAITMVTLIVSLYNLMLDVYINNECHNDYEPFLAYLPSCSILVTYRKDGKIFIFLFFILQN